MNQIKKNMIQTNCTATHCPKFETCCQVACEINYISQHNEIDILFVGQGAGHEEDYTSNSKNPLRQPFFGVAGKYLRNIILHEFWEKGILFNIALDNIAKYHPHDTNGSPIDPEPEIVSICINHLKSNIRILSPKIVMPLGRVASLAMIPELQGTDKTMGQIRHKSYYGHPPYIPTYHPSFLQRNLRAYKPEHKEDEFFKRVIADITMAIDLSRQTSLL